VCRRVFYAGGAAVLGLLAVALVALTSEVPLPALVFNLCVLCVYGHDGMYRGWWQIHAGGCRFAAKIQPAHWLEVAANAAALRRPKD